MGRLSDIAKSQSKFLLLDVGESAEATFDSFNEIPNSYDPEKTTIQYKLIDTHGKVKFWTNGSAQVMNVMDKAVKGSKVKISRNPLVDKSGVIVTGKSSWQAEIL